MRDDYEGKGLSVVGVTGIDPESARTFRIETGASYAILCEADASFADFGVRTLPAVYLIDPEGQVRYQGSGVAGANSILAAEL